MDPQAAVEYVFREQSGRIVASLIRISRSFDAAEEAMQEAFAAALASWSVKGLPDNPAAWITATAHRKLIDRGRRERTWRDKQAALQYETEVAKRPGEKESEENFMHLPDDRLRLIFTCCHPALNRESQIALTLRTLGGLSTQEIAKAFLLPEPTLAQRLVRAKRKIQDAGIPYEIPSALHLSERLKSVQAVIYLVFNEGYAATAGDQLVRGDLCSEAIRLGRVLCELLPREPENLGLLALMLLHDSRREARVLGGRLITLEEQDRSVWDRAKISEGLAIAEGAFGTGPVGPYQLQAAITALHAQAETPQETDWRQIAALYQRLLAIQSTPVVALNYAVAVAMGAGLEEGLNQMDALGSSGELDNYYLFHAARADILLRMKQFKESAVAYRRALGLAANRMEQEFLARRLAALESELAGRIDEHKTIH
jgi:RNA polymerase sigma-70 factor (ECF subfamily)